VKNAGIVWGEEALGQFLQGSRIMVLAAKVAHAGVTELQDRADVIAYLERATKSAPRPAGVPLVLIQVAKSFRPGSDAPCSIARNCRRAMQ
jgi:hypothetical protein